MGRTVTNLLDFKSQSNHKWITYGLGSMVSAPAVDGHECSQARALSNLIGQQWLDHSPLNGGYWMPRRSDARHLFGRDLSVSGPTANGGNLAAMTSVMAVAEATRPLTVLQRAGATVMEVANVESVLIPAWDEDANGYWVKEGQAVTAAGLAITSGTATPKTAGATMTLSRRAVLQMDAIEAQVTAELRRIVAGTLEAGFWSGNGFAGDAAPMGIINTPGTQTKAFAAAVPTYSELVAMADLYFDNGGDPSAMVFFCHPGTLSALMTQEVATGSGSFVAGFIHGVRQVSLFGVPVYPTKHITEGVVVLCNPGDVYLLFWRAPQLNIARTGGNRSITGEVQITVLNDADVVVSRRHQMVIGKQG